MLEVTASFFLHETYIPILLKRKVARAKKRDAGGEWYSVLDLWTDGAEKGSVFALAQAAIRPSTCTRRLLSSIWKVRVNSRSNLSRSGPRSIAAVRLLLVYLWSLISRHSYGEPSPPFPDTLL